MNKAFSESPDISQQDLSVLLDHAPDAIGRFDRKLRHVYVNEATARENNRPASDFHMKTMEELGHTPEVCETINNNLLAVFDSGVERTIEMVFEGPFGPRRFQCRMAPEFEGERVEYVLVMSRDISDQQRAQTAVREAEERSAALQLTAVLAHEINNPLAVLVNSIYLLQRNPSLDDAGKRVLKLAAEAAERIAGVSKQMLELYAEKAVEERGK